MARRRTTRPRRATPGRPNGAPGAPAAPSTTTGTRSGATGATGAVASSLAAHPALLAISACLDQPDALAAFARWLQGLPPDEPCTPPMADVTLGGQYWTDHVENPLGRWVKAMTGRAIWIEPTRWRRLTTVDWHPLPDWAQSVRQGFVQRTHYLPECRRPAGGVYGTGPLTAFVDPPPTPERVLRLLDQVLPLWEGEAPDDEVPA
jgi:hypothetical protein